MTQLQQQLDLLFQMMAGQPGQPPVPSDVLITELSKEYDHRGCPVIATANLLSIEQYAERFSELMEKGFAWINLNYYGLLNGKALVTVEFPNYEPPGRARATSVNFSGPKPAVADSLWDAGPHVVVR